MPLASRPATREERIIARRLEGMGRNLLGVEKRPRIPHVLAPETSDPVKGIGGHAALQSTPFPRYELDVRGSHAGPCSRTRDASGACVVPITSSEPLSRRRRLAQHMEYMRHHRAVKVDSVHRLAKVLGALLRRQHGICEIAAGRLNNRFGSCVVGACRDIGRTYVCLITNSQRPSYSGLRPSIRTRLLACARRRILQRVLEARRRRQKLALAGDQACGAGEARGEALRHARRGAWLPGVALDQVPHAAGSLGQRGAPTRRLAPPAGF
eukprot:5157734-Prymnesium_polylepis.2